MRNYLPDVYQKDIFHIDYQALSKKGVRCLIFDLDNTVATLDEDYPNKEVRKLLFHLKENFYLLLISNSFKKRVKPFGKALDIPYLAMAMKPFSYRIQKLLDKKGYVGKEIAIIGDQFMTDMALGHKLEAVTIFVDTLSSKEYKVTSINRYREMKLMKKYEKLHLFERGHYYG